MASGYSTPLPSASPTLHEFPMDVQSSGASTKQQKQKQMDADQSTSAPPPHDPPAFLPATKAISRDIDQQAVQRVHTASRGFKLDREGAFQPSIAINEGNEIRQQLERQASVGISPYAGKGTSDSPFIVDWLPDEEANPYNWSPVFKWVFVAVAALCTLCIAFASSCYTGAAGILTVEFGVEEEIVILGVSLFVLGFGVGPLLWAPLSEMYGRRIVFLVSFLPFALFNLGGARAQNIETVIVTRFFGGAFGSSMLTNAGAMISDVFSAKDRGLATTFFALAPFLGPVLGPIVGGFAGSSKLGWRSVFYIMLIFALVMYIIGFFLLPETYAPTLLRRRARALQKASTSQGGQLVYYISKYDINRKPALEVLKINLTRPFILLFTEPIVFLLSLYISIVYGTLYLFFTAYPIVFQSPEPRGYGFSAGIGALPFIGLGVGMIIATCMQPITNRIYAKYTKASPTGRAPPEARLPMACFGAICLPVGIFWFAWTGQPSVHWIAPSLAGIPFGIGMLLVFTSVLSYLIDTYLLFAASALAANACMRAIFASFLPHVSVYMYNRLGNQWASTLVAFLSLICVPIPFLLLRYGPAIRERSKFAPTLPPPQQPKPEAAEHEVKEAQSAPSSHHHHHHDVEKVRQPEETSALEPEYALDAGEHTHSSSTAAAPAEMMGVERKPEPRGAEAV